MRLNENYYFVIFLFLSSFFFFPFSKNFISKLSLDYIYQPFILLKVEWNELLKWRKERETLYFKPDTSFYKINLTEIKKKEDGIFARGILYEPISFPQNIVINKGEEQGIREGMPVLFKDIIIGKVESVQKRTSSVKTIFSPEIRFGVIDERSGVLGVCRGTGEENSPLLQVLYVPVWVDIKQGDTLLTSGYGGRFPAGYRVGIIKGIEHSSPDELFLKVSAISFFDPSLFTLYYIPVK